jgi:hypothetical protein
VQLHCHIDRSHRAPLTFAKKVVGMFLLTLFVLANAWWDGGHLLIAQIAMNELANDTDIVNSIQALLNDTSRLFFNDTSDFVSAALWSDDLKGYYKNQMFSNWHFVVSCLVRRARNKRNLFRRRTWCTTPPWPTTLRRQL